jgi:hypothetical protein
MRLRRWGVVIEEVPERREIADVCHAQPGHGRGLIALLEVPVLDRVCMRPIGAMVVLAWAKTSWADGLRVEADDNGSMIVDS